MAGGLDPPHYAHTQPAHVVRLSMLVAALMCFGLVIGLSRAGDVPRGAIITVAVVGGMDLLLAILFWSMTVQITSDALELEFGPGPIRKRFPLADIASAEAVRTSWWQGWGIHWSPRGWLFNVSGFDAVRLRTRSGKAVLVGTDEPDALVAAIEAALAARKG